MPEIISASINFKRFLIIKSIFRELICDKCYFGVSAVRKLASEAYGSRILPIPSAPSTMSKSAVVPLLGCRKLLFIARNL